MASKHQNHKQAKWILNLVAITKFALGLGEEEKYKIYQLCHITLYLAASSINVVGCIVAIANNSSFKGKFVVSLFLTFHVFTIFYSYTITIKKRRRVISLINRFLAEDPNYIGPKSESLTAKFIKDELLVSTVLFGGCIVCFAFITLLFKDNAAEEESGFVDDFYDYAMPLWFSCGDGSGNPITTRLCWKVHGDGELLFCNMTQMILLSYESMYFYFALIGIICLTRATEAKGIAFGIDMKEMEIRTTALAKVSGNEPSKHVWQKRRCVLKYDEEVWKEFEKMLSEQLHIQRFVSELMSVLREEMFFCVLCVFSFVLLGTAGVFAEANAGIYFRMRCACIALLTLYIHYKMCENMHHIYEVNRIISEALYDFCWYQQSIKFKKLFAISLVLNQQIPAVKIHSSYVVNLSYFADNVKRLYSVLGILKLKSSAVKN